MHAYPPVEHDDISMQVHSRWRVKKVIQTAKAILCLFCPYTINIIMIVISIKIIVLIMTINNDDINDVNDHNRSYHHDRRTKDMIPIAIPITV